MVVRTTDPQQSQIIEKNNLTASNSAPSKLRKGAKSKYIIEEHPIMDGMGKVVRTRHTGDTYHCFFYIKSEQKWLRKTLGTKRLGEALDAGRSLMMITLGKVQSGERVFAKSYQDVVDEYLKEKQEDADSKMITQGRVVTLRSALKWAIEFAGGGKQPITTLDGMEWKRYYVWRRTKKSEVRDVTLVNERSAISALFKFADQKRYLTRKHMPVFDKSISKNKVVDRREAFNSKE